MSLVGSAQETGAGDVVAALRAVYSLSDAMAAATSVECIYQAALDALICSLPVPRAAILLLDNDGVMRFKAWRGLSDGYRAAAEGHSPWGRDERRPAPVVIADVAEDATLGPLRETILAEGIAALAFIPLVYGTTLQGKFMLYCDQPHDFAPDELALARAVAGHIGFALEKRRLEDELRRSAADLAATSEQLGATLNAVRDGITVQGPDGRLILANNAAATWLGFASVADLLAARVEDVTARFDMFDADADGEPLPVSALPGRAVLDGGEAAEMLVRSRRRSDPDVERFSLVSAQPVRDQAGEVMFAVNVFRDVTERKVAMDALAASEARLAFLASASRRLLATALEPGRVLEEVARLVVPELADWCTVRETTADGRLERVSAEAARDGRSELHRRLESYGDLLKDNPALGELQAGRSILVSEVTAGMLERLAVDDEHLKLLRQLRLRSVMLVPLRTRGRTIGSLSLASGAGRAPYGDSDVALVEELAARVAAKVDSARLYADEHSTAETLARALLPGRLPDLPGLSLAARYRAAGDVGGDFYDCFAVGDDTWMLVVGDVCGRGIPAASMTGVARSTIRAAALHTTFPAAVLADVNRLLLDSAASYRDEGDEPGFCTVCLAAVTPTPTGAEVTVTSAGHPLPMLVAADGSVAEVGRPGSLLGVIADIELCEQTCHLEAGDTLVLFTDGITERRSDGQLFGEDQLAATLHQLAGVPADQLVRRVEQAAVSFGASAPQDDMAIVAISVPYDHRASRPHPTELDDPLSAPSG